MVVSFLPLCWSLYTVFSEVLKAGAVAAAAASGGWFGLVAGFVLS
jgi:hypothetical protein